jgi:hypothetical protein
VSAPSNPAFVDDVVVDRVVDDLQPGRELTPAERAEVARRMHAKGFGTNSICARLTAAHRDVTAWINGRST